MYSYIMERPMKANSVSTNEELGQIEYVMSDKTGTLTCNKMVFKEIAIGKMLFEGSAGQSNPSHISSHSNRSFSRISSVQGLRDSYQKSRESDPYKEQDKDEDTFDYENLKKYLSKPIDNQDISSSLPTILASERLVIEEMMNIITTCHECLLEPKTNKYQGPSPDEVTLVEAASKAGYVFTSISNKSAIVKKFDKEDKFEILQVF